MRILILDQFAELGGAQQCLLDLLPALIERGWDLEVAAPRGPLLERAERLGARVAAIRLGAYSSYRKGPLEQLRFAVDSLRLSRRVRELATGRDLLYVDGPRLLPAVALSGCDAPVLFHCQSRLFQSSAAAVARWAIRRTRARVVACCEYAAAPLSVDARIVYNPGASSTVPARDNDAPVIGVIGRVSPEKGQLEFVRAARAVAGERPEARFVVCGDALFDDPAARAYAARVRREANGVPVEFLGWRDDPQAVLAGLDLVVIPSIREPGTTRVVFEAYAHSKPVVAFDTGGISEVLTDGETGTLVREITPEALARAILETLDRPGQLGHAGHALWRERFTIERYQSEMIDAITWAAR